MQICVGNKIIVKEPTEELKSWCRTNLVLGNPEYYKKQQMGKWCGNIQRNIVLYEKDADTLYLPFGCIEDLYAKYHNNASWSSDIRPTERINYKSDIDAYDYQEKAINEAIRHRNGIIVMPCGSGKTQTALELISRLGGKCLWLTHTQELLNQSMNRAKAVYGIDKSTYGTITGGKVNIGSGITFATVQTMSKIDLTQYKYSWDIIVVDECHKAIGSPTKCMQFYKVLSALCCRHKFGLTATPKRADGLEQCMYALIGNKVAEVSKEDVKHTTCEVKVMEVETGYSPDINVILSGDGTINYGALVDDLTHNEERFNCVSGFLENLKCEEIDGPTLVLANRVEYLERLCDRYCNYGLGGKAICLSSLGTSKASRNIRKTALENLNNGKLDCIFATYQLAKEGLDVPNLRYVVFATPEKDPTTVEQSAGRVGRKADGKEFGTVIDFVDDFGMLKGWSKKRNSIYKKLGFILT